MFEGASSGPLDGCVQLGAFRLELAFRDVAGDGEAFRPTDHDARKRLGNQEAVPRIDDPSALGLQVEDADGGAGELLEFDGPHFCLVDGTARSIGGEDCGTAAFDYAFEPEQSFAACARTRSACSVEAEHAQDACDQLAVKAAADEDDGVSSAEIEGAGQDALVPEAVNLAPGFLAESDRRYAFLGDHLIAPRKADDPEQHPNDARHDGQNHALRQRESGVLLFGHSLVLLG